MFFIISFILIFSAIMVITAKHILHSSFYLVATLICIVMYFILLRAEYLAAVQILVYIGSIVVMIIFALMLTRTKVGDETNVSNNQKIFAALTAMVLFICLTLVFFNARFETVVDNASKLNIVSIKQFSQVLFSGYTLPFEISSLLLLAALVGSVVLAMKEKVNGAQVSDNQNGNKENIKDGNIDEH